MMNCMVLVSTSKEVLSKAEILNITVKILI